MESHGRQTVLLCQFQTGAVTGGQRFLILPPDSNRAYGVQYIAAGEVVGGSELGLSGGLRVSLPFHDPGAVQPQLNLGKLEFVVLYITILFSF